MMQCFDPMLSLLVNDWMATILEQCVYKLLYRQPIHSFLTYIDADSMAGRSVSICQEELKVHL